MSRPSTGDRRGLGGRLALTVIVAALLWPARARAQDLKDRFNINIYAQGMYMAEQQLGGYGKMFGREAQVASPFELGYGELRAIIDGRRLPGSFDLHLDGRVRMSGQFSTDAATQGADQIVARGYLGGREYEVREAWTRRRGEKWDFGLGRMIVAEADALRLDGARLWWRMAKHWDASLYAGAYPDPFSRSLTSDYVAGFAFAGGADATYTYDKIWGSFSANGAYLGGKDDGGPLDPGQLSMGTMAPGNPKRETPRTWVTWTDYVRLVSWLDLFTDVVVDATGAAGVQLTRLDALATVRAGKHVTFHAGYDHLSAFAIEMWLTRLLQSRLDHQAMTIENNMIVERTARDEVRGDVDVSWGKASVYADGRFRKRAVVSLKDDPQFVSMAGKQVAPGMAWDVTLGLRDRGTLAGFRTGLWGTYLSDYRSRSIFAGLDVGRGFFDDRLDASLSFLYANTKDALANNPAQVPCTVALVTSFTLMQNGCYGTRAGSEYEMGLTVSGMPFNHWFAFLDYRLVADLSGGAVAGTVGTMTPIAQPTILTHVLLLRIEARY